MSVYVDLGGKSLHIAPKRESRFTECGKRINRKEAGYYDEYKRATRDRRISIDLPVCKTCAMARSKRHFIAVKG